MYKNKIDWWIDRFNQINCDGLPLTFMSELTIIIENLGGEKRADYFSFPFQTINQSIQYVRDPINNRFHFITLPLCQL